MNEEKEWKSSTINLWREKISLNLLVEKFKTMATNHNYYGLGDGNNIKSAPAECDDINAGNNGYSKDLY
ncbi:hypothetical protein KY284_012813 [Solanum tuberosum]|nr:hypothetical protein KY284_012813 [Solanum tuberosum]